jgi:hypothetical protein
MKIKILNHGLILLLLISWTQVKAQNYKTIKLEVNQEQVDLTITPVADALIEDLETVDFRLEESQDYLVSGIRSAQIGLSDAPVPPDITGFAPGQVNPGMTLLIRGHGFVGVTTVSFNGVLAEFTVDSPNQITAIVPLKAGSGPIAVGTPAGAAASSTELQVVNDASLWTRSWDLQNSGGANQNLNAVAFGDGLYVAVGAGGRIMTSPDAIKWTTQRSPTSMDIYGVASGALNGVHWFLATAGGSTREMGGLILKSRDGFNWETNAVDRPVFCVAYSGKSFLVGGVNRLYQSEDLVSWQQRQTPRQDSWAETAVGLTYGGGQFVMTTALVNHDGRGHRLIFTSTDGVKWERKIDRQGEWWYRYGSAAYGPDFGYLIIGYHSNDPAGGYCGSGDDCYNVADFWHEGAFDANSGGWAHVGSLDAKTWTERSKPDETGLFGVTYGDGTFVAVGNNGTVCLTSDGIAWQKINAGTDRRLRSVVYGGGQFVAVGQNGIIVSSKYGSDWTIRSPKTDFQIRDKVLRSIVDGSLGTVVVGHDGTLLVSRDGNTWTRVPNGGTVLEHIPGEFTWSQAKADAAARGGRLARTFVLGDVATKVGWLAASDQGAEGQWRWEGAGDTVSDIPWFAGQPNGGLSENYAVWNGNGGVEDRPGNQANGYFIERVNELYPNGNLTGVACGLGRYVVVGFGEIFSAVDPSAWRRATIANSSAIFQVVRFLNGMFVALGDRGVISTSTDGLAWTARSSGVTTSLRDVTFSNNKFVAVGLGGTIITSVDAINWKKVETGNVTDLYGVTVGMGQFVIVGDNLVWTSDTGDIWRLRSLSDRQLRTVQFLNNQFIAAGVNGVVIVSADARSWTAPIWLGEAWKRTFTAVTIGQGRAWLIGEQGTILRSGKLDLVASVFITALDATASEVGPRPARIQIRRSGDLSKPLTVRIRIDGTAKELDDYVITGPLLR